MKGKNMILLAVAVLAIGLFVLPQTMAMFVGQHTWFSVKTADSQYVMCQKCHVNEVAEWRANTGAHANYSADLGGGCFCHQINETALAAYGLTESNALGAYGFNFTNWRWNYTNTTGGEPVVHQNGTTPHQVPGNGAGDQELAMYLHTLL